MVRYCAYGNAAFLSFVGPCSGGLHWSVDDLYGPGGNQDLCCAHGPAWNREHPLGPKAVRKVESIKRSA